MHVLRVHLFQGRLAFNLFSNKLRGRRTVEYKTWVVVGLKWGAEHRRRIRRRNRKFLAGVAMTNVHTVVVSARGACCVQCLLFCILARGG